MKLRNWLVTAALLAIGTHANAAPFGTSFTFQGQLKLSGVPVNGAADFIFSLHDAATLGVNVGGTIVPNVTVVNGVFTVQLDFGAAAFNGDARWLEVAARSPAGSGAYTTLSQRQPLTAAPYALQARGLFVDAARNVGIGTTAPISKFNVDENTNANLDIVLDSGLTSPFYTALDFSDRGTIRWSMGKDNNNAFFINRGGSRQLTIKEAAGEVGIGTSTPNAGLHVKKEPSQLAGTLALEGTTHTYMSFYPSGLAAGRKAWFGFGGPGATDLTIWNDAGGNINLSTPGAATRVSVLEITGADLAEKFPTSDKTEPGMVVAIDSKNPGMLCLARGSYNTCVAGVVSGANDFPAGAVLGNLPEHKDAPPVALSGRVYVWCDASTAAIAPGNLLTTSSTPGHAMKATDRDRSHGAIIGKAMTSLNSGRGLVLVLVNLQ